MDSKDSLARLSASSVSVADPDLQIREGSGHPDPEIRRVGGWGGGGGGGRVVAFNLSLV